MDWNGRNLPPLPVLSCCLNLSNHPLDLFRYMYMCIRIDMNIFCDPYLHITCLTKTRSQARRQRNGHCTLVTRTKCTHAVTLGSLINWCTCRSTMSDSCTSHYLDLGRHTLIVSSDLKALSAFCKLSFTFSNVTTFRSIEPDCVEVPIDTFFYGCPLLLFSLLHCIVFSFFC